MFDWKTIVITGGTGTFGQEFVSFALSKGIQKIIVLSRDELKQYEMRRRFDDPRLVFFLGDVRDRDRLVRAFRDVDCVVHAAALKQVPALEYNPQEAIKTNILGASNVIDAAIECGVRKVIAISTDKAVNPVNLYGATKLAMEKLFVAGNSYSGAGGTLFSVVRYGNVAGSRGSVVPLFRELAAAGKEIPITDERMTRFWLRVESGVKFVESSIERMRGGEIFVPKLPSVRILDLARAIAPRCETRIIGIRPGEKLHESLVSPAESPMTREHQDHYEIHAPIHPWREADLNGGKPMAADGYSSDRNTEWIENRGLEEELCRI